MVRQPNYCKGIIIAHGKSELLLAEHIKSNLHLPIEIYSLKNTPSSVLIFSPSVTDFIDSLRIPNIHRRIPFNE